VYLILEKISERGWTRLRSRANLWLTMLFAFGTVHWYLAIGGKMWFLSQTVTVTLLALAFRVTLEDCKGWLPGMAIALAVAARPNVVMFLPVLLGIVAQSLWEKYGRVHFWKLVRWSAVFFIPVVLAILGMLGYNYARFGDPLDYGYLTENVAGYMADDLKNYGTFHPHFIARNLRVMFLGYPKIGDCGLPVPKHEGMSMLLSTPALLYLAGGIRRKPWVAGMWMGFLSMLIPLVMYYNTGAWQFGYKYLLDMIIPVMALLALAAGDRISWKFRILIMASILISLWGLLWWNGLWCP
jgi:hypothetical protein